MTSAAKAIFEESVAMVDRAIAKVHPGTSIGDILRTGEFEQAVYMMWVASRLYFFDIYLPSRREDLLTRILQLNPVFASKTQGTFTREEVIALVKSLAEPVSSALSNLRQGQTAIRGNLFEYILNYPLAAQFDGLIKDNGARVSVLRTPKKRLLENIDLSLSVGDTKVIGLSVKGNVRERLMESIQRAGNAMDRGYFSHVWHCVLTSGDNTDKESLNTALMESLYHGHRIYTWSPLCEGTTVGFPRGAQLLPLSKLPQDIAEVLGV